MTSSKTSGTPSPIERSSGECDKAEPDPHRRFVRWFAQYEHEVYAYVVAVLSNWADADEVMQETSIALWEMFDQFEEGTNFSALRRGSAV